ncbi:MAG: TetR/AcrR family transcriptional regulator, partial [Marivivens sp.]|nr:TetR/AcrR family transcriptional regulator [Marivivens sp.]
MARKQGSHSDITGPKVREAALKLIAQHGYAAVSMRQIAAEVGVQAGALYNYTADKQSLLFDIVLDHMDDLVDSLNEVDLSGPPWSALEAFIRFHILFHVPRVEQVFISYMELRNL